MPKGKLTIECDEAWPFVGNKGNKQWIRLAMDKKTREIVGVYVGERSESGAIVDYGTLYQQSIREFSGGSSPPIPRGDPMPPPKHSMPMRNLFYRFLGIL